MQVASKSKSNTFLNKKYVEMRSNRTGIFFADDHKMYMSATLSILNMDGGDKYVGHATVNSNLNSIPTRWEFASSGLNNADDILNSKYLPGIANRLHFYLHSNQVHDTLANKEIEVRITGGSADDDYFSIAIDSINSGIHYPVFSKENINRNVLQQEWMKGIPILSIFEGYSPHTGTGYYLKVEWSLRKDDKNFTDSYLMDLEYDMQSSYFGACTRDVNKNGVMDAYEDGITGQPCPGLESFEYQGQTYNTVQIGNKCWMKENLNYETGNSWCYDDDPANCNLFGRLYDWYTVMNGASASNLDPSGVQGICPPGWHVPSDREWWDLEGNVDSKHWTNDGEWQGLHSNGYDAGDRLKSTFGWEENSNGSDLYGFTGLPGGEFQDGYRNKGTNATWWTTSARDSEYIYYHRLTSSNKVSRWFQNKHLGVSLRCVKN
jgi:uncharacterized protein (TIGR02145 family)